MSTETKKKELTKQLQELNNRRAEYSETELLALSLKYLNDAKTGKAERRRFWGEGDEVVVAPYNHIFSKTFGGHTG